MCHACSTMRMTCTCICACAELLKKDWAGSGNKIVKQNSKQEATNTALSEDTVTKNENSLEKSRKISEKAMAPSKNL